MTRTIVSRVWSHFSKNTFLTSVSTLALGTIIGQLILFLASPLLARLYAPDDFGVLALFTGISTIMAVVTTGRYELAIGLPKKKSDAINIIGLIFFIALFVSLFFLLIIFVTKNLPIHSGTYKEFVNSPIVFFIPVFTFLAAISSALQYWVQRKKGYKQIAVSCVCQAGGVALFNILFGLSGYLKYGMVYSLIIGQFVGILVLLPALKKEFLKLLSIKRFKVLATKYIKFPRYLTFSDLSTATSQQMVPILFSALFTSLEVGFFALAYRMLKIPSIVLTSSIANVFRNEAIDSIQLNGNCRKLYLSTLKKLIILCIPVFLLLALISPWLFSFIYGKNWVQSGYYAQIICIMMIVDFLAVPFNSLFYIVQKQKIYMRIQTLNMIFGFISIYFGYIWFNNAYYSILLFAINNGIFGFISLYQTYNLSKNNYILKS